MSRRRIQLTLDCDGVLSDIWTPAERVLRTYTEADIEPYISGSDTLDKLLTFARAFKFTRDSTNFELSLLTDNQYRMVCDIWSRPDVFMNAPTMPDYTGGTNRNWLEYSLGTPRNSSPTFSEIANAFDMLSEICDITIHTHIPEQCVQAREQWFNENILSRMRDTSHIKLYCDTGAIKQQLSGDIVVEDRLFNLLNANAEFKVLRGCFHNQPTKFNKEIWVDFRISPLTYHKISPICVSNFTDMVTTIYIEAMRRYDQ